MDALKRHAETFYRYKNAPMEGASVLVGGRCATCKGDQSITVTLEEWARFDEREKTLEKVDGHLEDFSETMFALVPVLEERGDEDRAHATYLGARGIMHARSWLRRFWEPEDLPGDSAQINPTDPHGTTNR